MCDAMTALCVKRMEWIDLGEGSAICQKQTLKTVKCANQEVAVDPSLPSKSPLLLREGLLFCKK